MLPVLNVGPLAIQLPGLLLLVGVWCGSILAERAANRHSVSAETITNLIFFSLVAGILGARLGYALRFINIYLQNPLDLLSLNPSTLSLAEGVLGGLLAGLIYGQRKGLALWPTLDSLTPGLAAFTVALGLAHLASGDAFGAPSQVPWAIELWGASRHPTQIYEIILALLAGLAVLRIKPEAFFPGFTFLSWIILISAIYLFIGGFRGDSVVIFQVIRRGQLVSLAVLVAAMLAIHFQARRALESS